MFLGQGDNSSKCHADMIEQFQRYLLQDEIIAQYYHSFDLRSINPILRILKNISTAYTNQDERRKNHLQAIVHLT